MLEKTVLLFVWILFSAQLSSAFFTRPSVSNNNNANKVVDSAAPVNGVQSVQEPFQNYQATAEQYLPPNHQITYPQHLVPFHQQTSPVAFEPAPAYPQKFHLAFSLPNIVDHHPHPLIQESYPIDFHRLNYEQPTFANQHSLNLYPPPLPTIPYHSQGFSDSVLPHPLPLQLPFPLQHPFPNGQH